MKLRKLFLFQCPNQVQKKFLSRTGESECVTFNLTELSTKPPDYLPPAGMVFGDRCPIRCLRDFFCSTVIVPGKARNGSAGGLVNSAVTALFTKPLYGLSPYRTTSGGCSCQRLPLTANGHFSVPQELYQSNQWNGREP